MIPQEMDLQLIRARETLFALKTVQVWTPERGGYVVLTCSTQNWEFMLVKDKFLTVRLLNQRRG